MVDVQWKQVILDNKVTKYEISNNGEVRNGKTMKLLSIRIIPSGYKRTTLYINNKQRSILVHRLVAQGFVSKPENSKYVWLGRCAML